MNDKIRSKIIEDYETIEEETIDVFVEQKKSRYAMLSKKKKKRKKYINRWEDI